MKGARLLLVAAFVIWCIVLAQPAILLYSGRVIRLVYPLAQLLTLPILALAAREYHLAYGALVPEPATFLWKRALLVVTLGFLTLSGIVFNGPSKHIIFDLFPFVAFYYFVKIGRYDAVWDDLEKPLLTLFWLCVPLILIGTRVYRPDLDEAFGVVVETEVNRRSERLSVVTLAYRIQGVLALWPLLFAMGYYRPRLDRWKIMGMGTLVFMLALEVFFQKRAPVMRTLLYAGMVVGVVPLLQRRLKIGSAAIMVVVMVVSVGYLVGTSSYEGLLTRFGSERITESARYLEATTMLSQLNPLHWIAGKGMAGYFLPPMDWTAGRIEMDGMWVRTTLHVGILYPLLKGGLLFVLVFYAFFLPIIYPKGRAWYDNRYNAAAMAVLPVFLLFQLIEGPLSMSTPMLTAMVGLCCARVCAPSVPAGDPVDERQLAEWNAMEEQAAYAA